jgi:NHLM bacteriocin system ABC transporter ATP-binding protein
MVLEGNQPLLLNRPGTAWLIESGSVAVFSVDIEDGSLTGERRFLFDVGAGEILLGTTTPTARTRGLIAVAVQESVLGMLEARQVVSATHGRAEIEAWIGKLASTLAPLKPNAHAPVAVAAGQQIRLKSGEAAACSGNSIVWVRVLLGSARLMGYDEGQLEPSDELIPLPQGVWLQTPESVELCAASPAGLSSEQLLRGAALLEPVFFRALEDLNRLAESEYRSRFEQRQELNQRLASETLRDLAGASLIGAPASVPTVSGPPLLVAAQVVGQAQGITIRPAVGDLEARRTLQAIALASGVRTRRVILAGRWWVEENGPLLAYKDAKKAPVALVPARPSPLGQLLKASRYTMFDPADRSWTPVSAAVAARLFPVASSFYRPFGDKRSTWDLLRFGVELYHRDLLMIVVCAVVVVLFGMVTPQSTAILVNRAIPDGNRSLVLQIALGMAAALLGGMLFDLTRSVSALRVLNAMTIALQTAAWDWLLKLRPAFYREFSIGDLRGQVDGFSRIHEQLTPETLRIVAGGLAGSAYVALMFYYSAPLGLLALLSGLVVVAATAASGISLSRSQYLLQQMEGAISGLMVQLINAVPKLRVAGAEQRAFAHWGKLYGRKQRVAYEVQRTRDRLTLVNATMPTLATGLAFGVALDGPDIGTFLAFSLALGMFMRGVTQLSDSFGGLVSIGIRWQRTRRILETPPEVSPGKKHPGRLAGRLALNHVSFRYREHGRLTLEDVSIHAEPGECIALVGPSGCGKSTILNLLLGFEVPSSGAIFVDGQDLADLDLTAVRRQIGVVRQDSQLMSESIFENITCGSPAPMKDAWEAARAAGLAHDIEQMPMGMHTVIAEGGSNISGGQKQRLLIARALVLKPTILLLDEATSALDNHTQQVVTESLTTLSATRVVVAHRLSTIRQADRIYVIQAGRVVQVGTYGELAHQPGLFAQLMRRQTA